jgi:hypothetical protein
VAKRNRGSRRDRRRGGRPAIVAPPTRVSQPQAPAVGELAMDGGATTTTSAAPVRPAGGSLQAASTARASSRLSTRADEYRYVTLDLRRIAAVMGLLFAAMIALWVAVDVARVVTI